MRPKTRIVGRPYPKVDAAAKVTGQTKFADDLFLPRMLHCKLLRSKVAHARLRRVDAGERCHRRQMESTRDDRDHRAAVVAALERRADRAGHANDRD